MRRLITLLLIIPALAVGQSRFGHGGGSSTLDMSTLLPIIADSTLWHLQGTDTLVTDGALPVKVSGLRVSGTTRLDGTLTMVTTAGEQVQLGTGSDAAPELSSAGDTNTGVRFPGSDITTFVQGGTEKARINVGEMDLGTAIDNTNMTVGLTIDQGANDDEILSLKSSDIAHGVTTMAETDVFGSIKKHHDANGGLGIYGYGDSYRSGLYLYSITASAPTESGGGSIQISAAKKSGTGTDALADTDILLRINNRTQPRAVILGSGNLGLGTTTPYSHLSVVDASSGQGTGFHVTSSQWNKARTTWATAHDTSSIAGYIDSAGGPRLSMKAVDGDTLGAFMDGTYMQIITNANLVLAGGSTNTLKSGQTAVGIWTSTYFGLYNDDALSFGQPSRRAQNIYSSDIFYHGGKGQTATQYISQENTIAGQDSSIKLWIDSGSPKLEMRMGVTDASSSNGKLRTYFGPDTLALFNGARTGRDSSWAALVNGNVLNNGIVTIKRSVSLTDAGEYTPQIPSGMCGWGSVQIGDDVEWARFRFKTDGTVTLEANSTNVGTTNDTDTKLNIYDAGTAGIVIENQLGSTLTAAFVIECHLP